MLKKELEGNGIKLGRDKLHNILKKNKLIIKRKKRYTITTNSNHPLKRYKNKFKDLKLERSNQVYVADITYINSIYNKHYYLFLLTDAYSRKIVGYSYRDNLSAEGAILAMKMALKPLNKISGLIHHSDRGMQYCSNIFTNQFMELGVEISMTEDKHVYENALAERINGILKQEFLLDQKFKTQKEARKAIREAIYLYNTLRPHRSLNLKTPNEVHCAA